MRLNSFYAQRHITSRRSLVFVTSNIASGMQRPTMVGTAITRRAWFQFMLFELKRSAARRWCNALAASTKASDQRPTWSPPQETNPPVNSCNIPEKCNPRQMETNNVDNVLALWMRECNTGTYPVQLPCPQGGDDAGAPQTRCHAVGLLTQ